MTELVLTDRPKAAPPLPERDEPVVESGVAPGTAPAAGARVLSLDAVRGLAIALGLFHLPAALALRQTPASELRDFLIRHWTHTRWDGVSFVDVGYPAFLAITGISLVLTFNRRIERGESRGAIYVNLLRKSLFLIAFAFFFNGGFSIPWSKIDFEQIFFIYAAVIVVAGAVQLFLSFKAQMVLVAVLAVGYSLTMPLVTARIYGQLHQEPRAHLDTILVDVFPTHFLFFYTCFLPRMVLPCLVGLLIGRLYLSGLTWQKKVLSLAAIGYALANVGVLLDFWIPINRVLWTPSYTLFSVGIACFFLAGFAQLIEVWRLRRLAMPWVVFGVYPLAAWAAFYLVPFDNFARRVAGDAFHPLLGVYHELFLVIVRVALCWLVFYWFYRRGISIRL